MKISTNESSNRISVSSKNNNVSVSMTNSEAEYYSNQAKQSADDANQSADSAKNYSEVAQTCSKSLQSDWTENDSNSQSFIQNKPDVALQSDITKLQSNIDNKVDKVIGKTLSKNDLTDDLKSAYDNAIIVSNNAADKDLSNLSEAGEKKLGQKIIGQLISIMCTPSYVPDGCLPCDGAEYSFTQFQSLADNYLLSSPAKLLTCTYSEYATSIATYGNCAKFGIEHTLSNTFTSSGITAVTGPDLTTFENKITTVGTYEFSYDGTNWNYNSNTVTLSDYGITITGTPASGDTITLTYALGTHFKVSTIKDGTFIQQAKSDSELGKSYNAGLPNITGYCAGNIGYQTKATGGCFYQNASSDGVLGPNSVDGDSAYQRFDASHSNSTYGNSTTVQPNAVALRFFVVVANGTLNQSQMDWSNYISALADKANVDLSNLSDVGKAVIPKFVNADVNIVVNSGSLGTSLITYNLSNVLPNHLVLALINVTFGTTDAGFSSVAGSSHYINNRHIEIAGTNNGFAIRGIVAIPTNDQILEFCNAITSGGVTGQNIHLYGYIDFLGV